MKNFQKNLLTREEMKSVNGGMEWSGCGSPNVIDCRPNPYGLGYMPMPTHSAECMQKYHYPTEHERDMECLKLSAS